MSHFGWCVVGAGPAGIATVGKLIDSGIPAQKIAWVDPDFSVGDLGKKWHRVQGNTKVKTFNDFLEGCKSFDYQKSPGFPIDHFDKEKSCRLGFVAEPLQWITQHLKDQVCAFTSQVQSLNLTQKHWHIELADKTIESKQVVLATGSQPARLNGSIREIPLEVALNDKALEQFDLSNETIAVFGASHSAMVVLENLLALNPAKIINFFRHPLKYAVHFENFTLFDDTGLKEHAAAWARENIDGQWPERLERVYCDSENFDKKLSECTRAVYAIGFTRNENITVQPYKTALSHNPHNGIIAPGLFGAGIAYPIDVTDPFGNTEKNVGIWKFMNQITRCLPLWMSYHA